MLATLLLAVALMLVLEGLLPFVAPRVWRDLFHRITAFNDGQLRFMGLTSMMVGLILITLFQ